MTTSVSSPAPMSTTRGVLRSHEKIRLTTRGRVVCAVFLSLLLLAGLFLFSGGSADAAGAMESDITHVVVVQPGENLWAIARSVSPEKDPRELVVRIRDLNALGTSHIYPGQSLIVPMVSH